MRSLTAVTRVYPGAGEQPPVHALGPIDLDLRKGEFFAVVGPSGCGKSTFLEVLAGLQAPTRRHGDVRRQAGERRRSPTASASCSRRTRAFPG